MERFTVHRHSVKIMLPLLLLLPCAGLSAAGTKGSVGHVHGIASTNQAEHTVAGLVTDEAGEPLIGVSVVLKGSSKGVITDIDGKFSLTVTGANPVLTVSYIGYSPQEIPVNGRSNISVVLKEESSLIQEVVVTALGIKRATKALSYNVQELKGEKLTEVKDANFMNSLAGKVAGVNINASSAGAGGATRVVMRGPKSINAGNNALYVIDGIPIYNNNNGATSGMYSGQPGGEGISDLNPDDIESISVLSGPAAAALYGSSAAQGVILVTTKKGKEGKVSVEYANSTTFSNPFVMPKFQNSYANRVGEFKSWGAKGDTYGFEPRDFFRTGSDEINSLAITVGSNKNQTYLSAAATNSDGILPNNSYDRYNFNMRNSTSFLNDRLTLDLGASYIIQRQQNQVAQGEYDNPLLALYLFPRGEDFDNVRQYEVYDEARRTMTQNWTWGNQGHSLENPYWQMKRKIRQMKRSRYMFNASLKYKVLDWLDLTGRVRLDNAMTTSTNRFHAGTDPYWTGGSTKGSYSENRNELKQTYLDLMANINKNFGEEFSVGANIGGSFSNTSSSGMGYGGPLRDMPNVFNLYNIDRANGSPTQSNWKERMTALFASAELGWRSMLYLTLTARNEWSSTLATTDQLSYFFPSVGLSGVISQMVQLPKEISYLKVRASYADVGSPLPRNLTQPRYTWNASTQTWDAPSHRPLSKLYPEKTHSWEVGLNSRFFNNTLSLDVTWYRSETKNQTFDVQTSAASGYSSMYVQSGNVRNWGMEFALGYNNKFGAFDYETNVTYSFNRNKVTELLDDYYDSVTNEHYSLPYFNAGNVRLEKGGTMGDIYTSTDLKRDMEGNIMIDENTKNVVREQLATPRKIGSVLPSGNLGWRNSLSWKGIHLSALLTARFGGQVVSVTQAIMDEYGVSKTSADARDAGGIRVNKGVVAPEGYYAVVGGRDPITQQYMYDADNVRLQELSFGYTIPRKYLFNTVTATVSCVARNLWMIYNKAPYDPENTASTGTYFQGYDYFMQPSLRSVGFNVKLQF